MIKTRVSLALAAVTTVALLSACTSTAGSTGADDPGLVIGTTDSVTALDPAGAYDTGSYTIIENLYEGLLAFQPGQTTPTPSLATSCDFTSDVVYTCVVPAGKTFSNGDALTASDVAFSFARIAQINDPNGPISMFASLDSVEATDDATVEFTLTQPDQTFPFVLASPAASIVDEDVFSSSAVLAPDDIVGSGPYVLTSYAPGEQTVLTANPEYSGDDAAKSSPVVVQSYTSSSSLKLAIEEGTVDVAYRNLDPADREALRSEDDVAVVLDGAGTDVHFIGFNTSLPPVDDIAVRRAVAYSVDRQAILDNVYDGVGTPLYSMVNDGFDGYTPAFADEFGTEPDLAAAEKELADAGITEPVALTLWWTPTHYGSLSGDEYTEIKRQLEETGLFTVDLQSSEWQQYIGAALGDQYASYELGGSTDYPSALVALGGFYIDGGFLNNHYSNAEINELSAQAVGESDAAARNEALATIQALYAEDAPTVPLWQGTRTAVTKPGITGVEETLDLSGTFRIWGISQ